MIRTRISIWAVVALCVALLISLAAPAVAGAQEDADVISDVTIVQSTIDMPTRVSTVTLEVTCLTAAIFVRGWARLVQVRGSRTVVSVLAAFGESAGCQAGQVLTFPIAFAAEAGLSLAPGPVEISGIIEALESSTVFETQVFAAPDAMLRSTQSLRL